MGVPVWAAAQEGWGRAITFSLLCRVLVWQASPSAACRAWETTCRMQASGVCCTCAASISSSRALHTEGDTSSGSTKRNTLRAETAGGAGEGDPPGGEPLEGHRQSLAAPRCFVSPNTGAWSLKVEVGDGNRERWGLEQIRAGRSSYPLLGWWQGRGLG